MNALWFKLQLNFLTELKEKDNRNVKVYLPKLMLQNKYMEHTALTLAIYSCTTEEEILHHAVH